MVNFQGFQDIVDTLGGVTINVQNPVLDDHYPGGVAGASIRVYIPAGVQHMDGAQALIYARSRHTSNDFDRAQRQQRVILSIREQVDPRKVLDNLSQLLKDLKTSFKTDIPQDKLPALIGLSSQIDTTRIRSFVFTPPRYGSEGTDSRGYRIEPNVSRIRQTVANAFKIDPQARAAARAARRRERRRVGRQRLGQGRPGELHRGLPRVPRPDRQRPDEATRPDVQPDDDQGLQRPRDGRSRRRSPSSRTCSTSRRPT